MSLNLSCEETWPSLPRTKPNPFPWLQKDWTCNDVHVQCIHQVWRSVDVGIVESDYPEKMQDVTVSIVDTVSDSDAFLCVGQSNTKCDTMVVHIEETCQRNAIKFQYVMKRSKTSKMDLFNLVIIHLFAFLASMAFKG